MLSLDTIVLFVASVMMADPRAVLARFEEITDSDGVIRARGYYRNAFVRSSAAGTIIRVGVPTFLYSSNAYPLYPTDFLRALEELAEALGLAWEAVLNAAVWRLDVGANLVLARPAVDYVRALADVPRAAKLIMGPASVVFKNGLRQLAFYDKRAELEAMGLPVPEVWEGFGVLRYELRYTRQVAREFGRPVTAEQLTDAGFYRELAERWQARFDTVTVCRPFRPVPATSVPTLRDQLALHGLHAVGGLPVLLEAIDDYRGGGLVTPSAASRQRAWARKLAAHPQLTVQPDVASELAQAVRLVAKDYLG